jgi:tetratricopeptide (TPR) repeat protein
LRPLAELALEVCKTCDAAETRDLFSDIYYTLGAVGTEANDKESSLHYNELFLQGRQEIAREAGVQDDRLGKAYNQLGISRMMHDEIETAIGLFQRALDVYRPLNNLQLLAMPTANLGLAYWLQGMHMLAASTLEQGLKDREKLHGQNDTESFR